MNEDWIERDEKVEYRDPFTGKAPLFSITAHSALLYSQCKQGERRKEEGGRRRR